MRIIVIIMMLLALSFNAWGADHKHKKVKAPGYSTEFKGFMKAMDSGMKKMMRDMHSAGYTGNPDVDFLSMMIPHHEGAIEMSRLLLIYGNDPLVRKLAEDIIASQTSEIEAMKRRVEILKRQADIDPEGFPALGGTRGKIARDKKSRENNGD